MKMFSLTDSSLLLQFGSQAEPGLNRQIHALAEKLAAQKITGLVEFVPGYASLVVHYDPIQLAESELRTWLIPFLAELPSIDTSISRLVEVPVIYDGPDLAAVAAETGLTTEELIFAHSKNEYIVYMMGFTPGFAYMGQIPEHIQVPRLVTPRTRVPAGSVAMAAGQTGIYPVDSPGGWRILGHTDLRPFDPHREPPFWFAPGDRVRFVPVS